MLAGEFFAGHQHGRRAIGQRRRGAGGDYAMLRIEGRLQRCQRFERGAGTDATVFGDHFAIGGGDCDDLIGQQAGAAGGGRFLVRCQRQLFLVGARHFVAACDVLGGLAHADVGVSVGQQFGIRRESQAALRHHGHRLGADAQIGFADAGLDLRCGDVYRRHRRAAEAVDGHAGHFMRETGQQADDAGHVIALRGFRISAAEDDVVQQQRVQAGALHQALYDLGCDGVRTGFGQLAFAGKVERGACIGTDYGFHMKLLWVEVLIAIDINIEYITLVMYNVKQDSRHQWRAR